MASIQDVDIFAELRSLPVFAELARDVVAELAASAVQRRVNAGVALVEQGKTSTALSCPLSRRAS